MTFSPTQACPLHDVTFMNIIKYSYYSRAALISLSSLKVRLLFEGGYYSGCGFYSNKYGMCIQHWNGTCVHSTTIVHTTLLFILGTIPLSTS